MEGTKEVRRYGDDARKVRPRRGEKKIPKKRRRKSLLRRSSLCGKRVYVGSRRREKAIVVAIVIEVAREDVAGRGLVRSRDLNFVPSEKWMGVEKRNRTIPAKGRSVL